MKLAIVCDRRPTQAQGVGDHARLLARELEGRGHQVTLAASDASARLWAETGCQALALGPGWNRGGTREAARRLAAAGLDGVIIEFTPYLYQAQGLPLAFARLAELLQNRELRVVTLMHELYIPWWLPARLLVAGAIQRLAVLRLFRGSDAVGVNFVGRHRWFLRTLGSDVEVTPSPANLPAPDDSPGTRLESRLAAGAGDGDLLLMVFGSPHRGLPLEPVLATLDQLDWSGVPWKLAVAGPVGQALAELLRERPAQQTRTTILGFMEAQALSNLMAAADVGLFPYEDGICSRRGSLGAALQSGLPLVSTVGVNTDSWLRRADVAELAGADDTPAFAAACLRLAHDPARRSRLRERGRDLYQRRFAWPVLTDQVERMLGVGAK